MEKQRNIFSASRFSDREILVRKPGQKRDSGKGAKMRKRRDRDGTNLGQILFERRI
jgi:hypothetical protein